MSDVDSSKRIYSVTLIEARGRLARAHIFRSVRTLERYCESGQLDCKKEKTANGQSWHTTDESLRNYIDRTPIDTAKTAPPTPQEATSVADMASPGDAMSNGEQEKPKELAEPSGDDKRPSSRDNDVIALYERMLESKDSEIAHMKAMEIELVERLHESNAITQSLQQTVLRLTGTAAEDRVRDVAPKPSTDGEGA